MVEGIDPVKASLRLAQLLGEDEVVAQAPLAPSAASPAQPAPAGRSDFSGNPFEDILAKAIESLEKVSKTEIYANELVDKFVRGEAELQEVMVAQAKMSIMVQLAVTTVNAAVTTFKEITQMQV
jgi:flagellar hook-basal body complex protein FliE